MRANLLQRTGQRAQNKGLASCLTIATVLCATPAAIGATAQQRAFETVPGGKATISGRTLLLLMLDSLLDALDDMLEEPEPGPEPEQLTGDDGDGLEHTAGSLILGYAVAGVDPALQPADVLEAIENTDDAELLILNEDLGLDQVLSNDLLASLQLMRADLEGMTQ